MAQEFSKQVVVGSLVVVPLEALPAVIHTSVAKRLNLKAGLAAIVANDLLPPRAEDKITGGLEAPFLVELQEKLASGRYEPSPVEVVTIPKQGLASRPATLMAFSDRIVYEALVDLIRSRLARRLMASEIVLWPRSGYGPGRWKEFLNVPLRAEDRYVVEADVAGYYDSVNHARLGLDIVAIVGDRDLAASLEYFLDKTMRLPHGLPQGLRPSDTLATMYLQPVDAALVRDGWAYRRHGDDIRCAVRSTSAAREAVSTLEAELRTRGLLLNSSKLKVLTAEQYNADLRAGDMMVSEIRLRLIEEHIEGLSADGEAFVRALNEADLEEMGWDVFYHGSIPIEEAMEALRPHLDPSEEESASFGLRFAMERAPDQEKPIQRELFHFLVNRSLVRLSALKSPRGIQYVASLVARFPEQTERAVRYLEAMAASDPAAVVKEIEGLLESDLFLTPWQEAWLFRVLQFAALATSETTRAHLLERARGDAAHWMVRVEAMKVLARVNKLARETLTAAWRSAPSPYRVDLVEVASLVKEDWAATFLEGVSSDAVARAVMMNLAGASGGVAKRR